jgi:tRNA modification GTPase
VALVGAPNAGKSTLLNALAGEARAIVSPEPGTTRDVVEARLEVGGLELILQDTAGLRESAGAIESEGIARTRQVITRADVVLLVMDLTDPHEPDGDVLAELSAKPVFTVWNKRDLASTLPTTNNGVHAISALTGAGVETLLQQVVQIVAGDGVERDDVLVTEARHHEALRAADALERSRLQLAQPTLLAADLRDAVNALGEITGETIDEAVLDRIFSKFCIGK